MQAGDRASRTGEAERLAVRTARAFMIGLTRLERALAALALAIAVGALLADLAGRELFGGGLFGALRVSVYATSAAAMLGFVVCVAQNAHIRITLLDRFVPVRWQAQVVRVGDLVSLLICLYFAFLSYEYVNQTFRLGETDVSLGVYVWPMQSVLIWAFLSAAVRFLIFTVFPRLRPAESEMIS